MYSLLFSIQVAAAGEIVVPSFTPGTVGDFGPAERLTEETLTALLSASLPFVAPSEVARRGGGGVVACADQAECPGKLFEIFPKMTRKNNQISAPAPPFPSTHENLQPAVNRQPGLRGKGS